MKLVDLDHGEKIFGSRDAAVSLLHKFINHLPEDLKAIHKDQQEQNYKAMYEKIHSLKGACCYASTPKLLLAVEKINKYILSLKLNNGIAPEAKAKIDKLCEQLTNTASSTIEHVQTNYTN